MNKRVEAIVEEARKLAPDEQDEVLRRLVLAREADEPADGTPAEIEAAWAAEIERRIAADERGETTWTPAADVLVRIRTQRSAT